MYFGVILVWAMTGGRLVMEVDCAVFEGRGGEIHEDELITPILSSL
jgi:hypothetical protein